MNLLLCFYKVTLDKLNANVGPFVHPLARDSTIQRHQDIVYAAGINTSVRYDKLADCRRVCLVLFASHSESM